MKLIDILESPKGVNFYAMESESLAVLREAINKGLCASFDCNYRKHIPKQGLYDVQLAAVKIAPAERLEIAVADEKPTTPLDFQNMGEAIKAHSTEHFKTGKGENERIYFNAGGYVVSCPKTSEAIAALGERVSNGAPRGFKAFLKEKAKKKPRTPKNKPSPATIKPVENKPSPAIKKEVTPVKQCSLESKLKEFKGITVENNGFNIWVYGEVKPIAEQLKALGLKWAEKRQGYWIRA